MPPSARIHCPTWRSPFAASFAGFDPPSTRTSARPVDGSWPTRVPVAARPVGGDDGERRRTVDGRRVRDDLTVADAHARDPADARSASRRGCRPRSGSRWPRAGPRASGSCGCSVARACGDGLRRVAEQPGDGQDDHHGQGADDAGADGQEQVPGPDRAATRHGSRRLSAACEQLARVNPGPIEGMRRRAVRVLVPCLLGGHAAECTDATAAKDRGPNRSGTRRSGRARAGRGSERDRNPSLQ